MADNNTTGGANGMGGVVATSRAETALAALAPEDRKQVLQAAGNLYGRQPWEWSGVYVISPPGVKPDYYLLTISPDWRAIVRQTEEGRIEITDVVREETLQLFRERQRPAGLPE